MNSIIINPKETLKQLEVVRNISFKDSHMVLEKVSKEIDWELLAGSIDEKINNFTIDYKSSNLVFVLRALALEIFFDIPVHKLNSEIYDRKSYQKFLGIHNVMEIPSGTLCSDVKNALYDKGLYENLTSLIEIILTGKEIPVSQTRYNGNLDTKIDQLEAKIRKIHGYEAKQFSAEMDDEYNEVQKIIPAKDYNGYLKSKQDDHSEKSRLMAEKLKEVNEKIDLLVENQLNGKSNTEKVVLGSDNLLIEKLQEINEKLHDLSIDETRSYSTEKTEKDTNYKKLYDSFYNQLKDISGTLDAKEKSVISEKKAEETKIKYEPVQEFKREIKEIEKDPTTEKLSKLEEEIKMLYSKLAEREIPKPKVEYVQKEKVIVPKINVVEEEIIEEDEQNEIDLKKKKRYHIFNNTNLTEDYELGLRFYKLGYKTAFINMRADERDENSRIATAEYFPNSFWGSVKQRSRWIAGIVFQNWKIHKWEGSLKTKYFLLRDRKAIFSFFGIFLSNIVFAYFVYYMLGLIFNFGDAKPTVNTGSVLYYLMISTLFFLIVRIVHRFAMTYNWYGFKYAASSIVRLLVDNLINLFATVRAVKVYKTNKKQIVWDSTDHY